VKVRSDSIVVGFLILQAFGVCEATGSVLLALKKQLEQ
jgi:hypothetical protein